MKHASAIGWAVTGLGLVLWGYGYFVTGNPPLFDWQTHTPSWIAAFTPNLEAEVGFLLMIAGSIPVYWAMYRQGDEEQP